MGLSNQTVCLEALHHSICEVVDGVEVRTGLLRFEAHSRVTTAVEHERGLLHGGVGVVIVRELAEGEELVPVVLSFVHEEAKELFELLVNTFGLAVRLRVVCGGRREFDAEEVIEFASEVGDELWASI